MTKAPLRVVINGFGRIGRTVFRQILTDPRHAHIQVVAINDIAPLDTCAYLFRYDSTFGPYPGTVTAHAGALTVDGRYTPFWALRDLDTADLSAVDVVLECTGTANTVDRAEAGLRAGATSVLISGPSPAAEATIVLGANEDQLGDARTVSNASCTTNAIAPLLRLIDQGLGIERAHITTIHCYTSSQPTVDMPGRSLERSRAAAVSMVPTSTSAADQVMQVLPGFQNRLSVAAVRVPSLSVSAIDATLQLRDPQHIDLIAYLRDTFSQGPIVGVIEDACVSSDLRARPESFLLALPETQIIADQQLRIFGWYDNEWGFSARMIDMANLMAARVH